MMKTLSYKFFNSKNNTKYYSTMYKEINFKESYPANVKRLEIFLSLIKKYKPKKIIDAGCGTGMPLIKIKKMGFNISGYDKAENMVKESKINLKNNNLDNLLKKYHIENVDIMSLDVEGYEIEMLNGYNDDKKIIECLLVETWDFRKISSYAKDRNWQYVCNWSESDFLFKLR